VKQDPEQAARASLRRTMLIYLALLAADLLVVYYIAANGDSGGAYITLSIVGLVGLLLAYQTVQHLRDLGAPLAESEGAIVRKWTRADLIIAMQSYYITVDRVVFRVKPEDYVHLTEAMYVKVVHFPNTLTVVSVHEAPGGLPVP
jgi:xanthosine utilization system XapX-like protein